MAEEVIDGIDLDAALEAARGVRQVRRLLGQRLVAREDHHDVFVAHEALARQAIARRHVVDFGVDDLLLGDLAELPQHLLFLFGERDGVGPLAAQVLHLNQAGSAIAILAIEGNRNLVRLGDRQNGASVASDGVDGDIARHRRR